MDSNETASAQTPSSSGETPQTPKGKLTPEQLNEVRLKIRAILHEALADIKKERAEKKKLERQQAKKQARAQRMATKADKAVPVQPLAIPQTAQ